MIAMNDVGQMLIDDANINRATNKVRIIEVFFCRDSPYLQSRVL